MIKRETQLRVCDNSGAKIVQCIGFFKSIKCNFVRLNDIIRVCIKKLDRRKFSTPKGKGRMKVVKKVKVEQSSEKERYIYRALIVSCKKPWQRLDGTFVHTRHNRVVLISDAWKFLGTRVYGPITKELRSKRRIPIFKELVSYAKRRL